jgi:transcriptional regulator with XRE-family HTH domain
MVTGERIKMLRKSLGLTQAEFGNNIGVVQGHLTGIERGDKNITKTTIKVICGVYGASEEWLLTGKGDMYIKDHGGKIYRALEFFNDLTPKYQDFALSQVKELLEIQRKQS